MPSSNNQSGSSGSKSNKNGSGNTKSYYAIAKEGGWSSTKNFYESYGLNMHDADDLAEGKAIMDAMNKADQTYGSKKN
jgi:hypothetical protein